MELAGVVGLVIIAAGGCVAVYVLGYKSGYRAAEALHQKFLEGCEYQTEKVEQLTERIFKG